MASTLCAAYANDANGYEYASSERFSNAAKGESSMFHVSDAWA